MIVQLLMGKNYAKHTASYELCKSYNKTYGWYAISIKGRIIAKRKKNTSR